MIFQAGRNPGNPQAVGGFCNTTSPAIINGSQPLMGIALKPLASPVDANRTTASWFGVFGKLPQLARQIYPASGRKAMKLRAKFVSHSLMQLELTRRWVAFWKTPELEPLATAYPRLLLKPQRLYLVHGLTPEKRWLALREHYVFALETFPIETLRKIFCSGGVLLAEVPAQGLAGFSLRLVYDTIFEAEGEMSLVLWDETQGRLVFALSFCISSYQPGRRKIFIGGLQGFKAPTAREQMVDLTRAMFGLRPKALLLFALQQLAGEWGINQLRAVSNETRTIRGRLPQLRKFLSRLPVVNRVVDRREVQANYDEFWLESGGHLDDDKSFTLPVAFARRPLPALKHNKRQLYGRRYALLDVLSTEIRKNLCHLSAGRK